MADDPAWDLFLAQARELKRYSVAGAVVVLYYDYVLTVATEYNRYWVNSRLSWTSFLFFLNRYSALIAHVVTIIQFFWDISDKTCRNLQWFSQIYCTVAISSITVLLCIRTYALYGQNRLLLFALIFLNSCGLAISCWAIITSQLFAGAPKGRIAICGLPVTQEQAKYDAVAWVPSMAFDCVIFALTLYKRIQVGRTIQNSLFTLMIRDGTVYFVFILALYILNLVDFLVWKDTVGMPALANAISSTLISRLMLNIRDPKNSGLVMSSSDSSSITFDHPRFISLIAANSRSSATSDV